MELRSTFALCFFLFLVLALPCFSTGGSEVLDSEMYEIDYRGPETHSSVPPPHHSHANPARSTLPETSPPPAKSTNLMATNHTEEKAKKIPG